VVDDEDEDDKEVGFFFRPRCTTFGGFLVAVVCFTGNASERSRSSWEHVSCRVFVDEARDECKLDIVTSF